MDCGVGKGSREREEWKPRPRFPVGVTKVFAKVWTATVGREAEVGGGWVVGCKCLWILRGEVWAVALGWRDGWEWCLKSQAFVQTNMGQARSDNGRLQGQGGLKLAGYSSWNGILSYGYFNFIFFFRVVIFKLVRTGNSRDTW